jgi:hypothetical protein
MVLLGCFNNQARAKAIEFTGRAQRSAYIRSALAWQPPSPSLTAEQVFTGPKSSDFTKLFSNSPVYCLVLPVEDQDWGGKTPKFECELLRPLGGRQFERILKNDGDPRVIKVKYSPPGEINSEVKGEILGTRLLWALGFYADQMFYVDSVTCFGCNSDPYGTRVTYPPDSGILSTFRATAIEKRFAGDSAGGFSFSEMMRYLPSARGGQEFIERDALRLLAVFMQHEDIKADNQRLVCVKSDSAGRCERMIMMIHDLGSTFGVRVSAPFRLKKVDLKTWKQSTIWKDPANCIAQMTNDLPTAAAVLTMDATMVTPKISDAGRLFLLGLLEQFSSDKRRVYALFRAAHIDEREIPGWVNVFLDKVQQIKYPLGTSHEQFHCAR